MALVKTWFNAGMLTKAVAAESEKRLERAAVWVEGYAKRSMKKGGAAPKTGAKSLTERGDGIYYNSDLKRYVRAAPEGQPPHTQTGNLRNSIQSARDGALRWVIGPSLQAFYGAFHEFGKRPFMMPALSALVAKFPTFFAELNLKAHVRGK